ncbi:MAG: hypothetical protein IKP17_04840 [Oscillospiraceae bacterium]|nr:hypothetical protein [Oscillospiraceae bacterium]
MQRKKEEYWLRDAVQYIKFPPDRRRVRRELHDHMLARRRDFLAEGRSEGEAESLACEAMGDPEEVGKALAAVHRPFWGYFLRALRIVLVLLVLFTAAAVLRGGGEISDLRFFRVYREEIAVRVPAWISQRESGKLGDYRFRLRRAGLTEPEARQDARYFREQGICLVLDLQALTWDPCLGPPRFALGDLAAEDSGGRKYPVRVLGERDLIFGGDFMLLIPDFDPEAAWAVLHFGVGEQSLHIPVRLKGAGE